MSETVVHVETIKQWKSVLDVWFSKGYTWYSSSNEYNEEYLNKGGRFLLLDDDNYIQFQSNNHRDAIEYDDFMKKQEKETYYVTQEQIDEINKLIIKHKPDEEKALLRYVGGDTSVEFKVKEQLYRLWRIDNEGDDVWFALFNETDPTWTSNEENAFTAPYEEIKKWKTPAWKIEKVD